MGSRTYIPTLVRLASALCIYITRYNSTLRDNMPSQEAVDALDALNLACEALLALVEIEVKP